MLKRKLVDEKYLHFCCGQHGTYTWQMENSKTFADMKESVITFCLDECNHPPDSQTHSFLRLTRKVNYDEIYFFWYFVTKMEASQYKLKLISMAKNWSIDFRIVLEYLFEFFQVETKYCAWLKNLLSTINVFHNPRTMLSVFCLDRQKVFFEIPENFIHETYFELSLRFDFTMKNNLQRQFYKPQILQKQEVSQILDIEIELLNFLHPQQCVLAGGAALKIGCRDTKYTNRCDADLFVFKQDNSKILIQEICEYLITTGRKIYQFSKSVLTCIGNYGIRKIQIIKTNVTNIEELLEGFDLDAVCACFDGNSFISTIGAQYAWLNKKCVISGNCYQIKADRLVALYWKGFELCDKSIAYLKNTIYS